MRKKRAGAVVHITGYADKTTYEMDGWCPVFPLVATRVIAVSCGAAKRISSACAGKLSSSFFVSVDVFLKFFPIGIVRSLF
jgi:hypothetical protein